MCVSYSLKHNPMLLSHSWYQPLFIHSVSLTDATLRRLQMSKRRISAFLSGGGAIASAGCASGAPVAIAAQRLYCFAQLQESPKCVLCSRLLLKGQCFCVGIAVSYLNSFLLIIKQQHSEEFAEVISFFCLQLLNDWAVVCGFSVARPGLKAER